jgi:hypothetical protein
MSFAYSYKPPYYPTGEVNHSDFDEYKAKLKEMQEWCDEQKMDHWGYAHGVFMFSFKEDYMMFLLRWS